MAGGSADPRHYRVKAGRALGLGLAGLAVCAGPAAAEPLAGGRGVFSFVVENDSLSSGNDRNYTSGAKLLYVAPEDVMPKWARAREDVTRKITGAKPILFSIGVGQSIFTPEDIDVSPAPEGQHPYAGFLYAELGLAAEGKGFLDQYELTLGMVGPSAMGRQAQQGIHSLLKAQDPQGWDSELNDEPVFALGVERRWRAEKVLRGQALQVDFTPIAGATLGTLRTDAQLGFALRLGADLADDYGPPRVKPALSGLTHFETAQGLRWNLFLGVDGRVVGRDIFLDGNTWKDSARVDKKLFVADIQAGATVTLGSWRFVYTYVTRTEEFETQTADQDFGVLAVSRLW